MISHTENTDVLNEAQRKTYLGAAYGMRAYLYFHLLRTYGKSGALARLHNRKQGRHQQYG